MATAHLLTLLQLASPALPVGAYSYSEGLETLATQGRLTSAVDLLHWLEQELACGSIRLETAVMGWVYAAVARGDSATVYRWNEWLAAVRETEEMRSQSWQMGRSLLRLFADLEPTLATDLVQSLRSRECHYAIAYAIVTHAWQVPQAEAELTYLQSWAANLISAAVRAVPLGQTEGQRLLRQLAAPITTAQQALKTLTEEDLMACSWGVTLASMQHETQYSRLFRS